jgi:branched-chain amino acid transport system ATP-binding protein
MKTILGVVRPYRGSVSFEDDRIDGLPPQAIVRRGIALVPEARRLFGRMTVLDNLAMGAYTRRAAAAADLEADRERVFTLFPRLAERAQQVAGTLSGGEQQMLAIGRALMARPRLLLLDEPTLGLAPLAVRQVVERLSALRAQGTTILLVEQNTRAASAVATRGYVLRQGRIAAEGTTEELLGVVETSYLGRCPA